MQYCTDNMFCESINDITELIVYSNFNFLKITANYRLRKMQVLIEW